MIHTFQFLVLKIPASSADKPDFRQIVLPVNDSIHFQTFPNLIRPKTKELLRGSVLQDGEEGCA